MRAFTSALIAVIGLSGAAYGRVVNGATTIVHSPAAAAASIRIELDEPLPHGVTRPSGWEQLRNQAARNAVVLTGSDVRSAIYAAYQFSQQFLDVDPLYYWADHAPPRRSEVAVPDDFPSRRARQGLNALRAAEYGKGKNYDTAGDWLLNAMIAAHQGTQTVQF